MVGIEGYDVAGFIDKIVFCCEYCAPSSLYDCACKLSTQLPSSLILKDLRRILCHQQFLPRSGLLPPDGVGRVHFASQIELRM